MKITGIIAEYNPFHNGHKHQIEKAKKFSDGIVAIMSGSFVQRGAVAITDKWTRADMAVKNGCDLVLELPVIYSLSSAQRFAMGAVKILDRINIIDNLYFGSECGDIQKLSNAADALINEPQNVSEMIKIFLDRGMSYPMAREKAYAGIVEKEILSEPNNILAIEYIKAIKEIDSEITPMTLVREGAGYHDKFPQNNIASASAIRNMLFEKQNIKKFVPNCDFKIYDESKLDLVVLSKLRQMSLAEISQVSDVNEGLENRIKDTVNISRSIEEVCNNIKSKRYPMSRIRRIIFCALLGIDKKIADEEVNYIRPLAMNETGAKILRQIKEKSNMDIIVKVADYKKEDVLFEKDILATDMLSICGKENMGMDYLKSPIVKKIDGKY